MVVEQNREAGQEADIVELLEGVYDVLLRKFQLLNAPTVKAALEFGQMLLNYFTAEDLEVKGSIVR